MAERKPMKQSRRIALGGLVAGLSCVFLFMAGLLPFFLFVMPMAAGALLVPICAEISPRWAYGVYAVTSILSLLMAPDREAVFFYIGLFGHYTVTKVYLERIRFRAARVAVKALVFAASAGLSILLTALTFGMDYLLLEFETFGAWGLPLFGVLFAFMLVLYDVLLSRAGVLYKRVVRKKISRLL